MLAQKRLLLRYVTIPDLSRYQRYLIWYARYRRDILGNISINAAALTQHSGGKIYGTAIHASAGASGFLFRCRSSITAPSGRNKYSKELTIKVRVRITTDINQSGTLTFSAQAVVPTEYTDHYWWHREYQEFPPTIPAYNPPPQLPLTIIYQTEEGLSKKYGWHNCSRGPSVAKLQTDNHR